LWENILVLQLDREGYLKGTSTTEMDHLPCRRSQKFHVLQCKGLTMDIQDKANKKEKNGRFTVKKGESSTTTPSSNVVCAVQFRKKKELREAQQWVIERAKKLDW
jgi:hypothetical protein